MYIQDLGEHQLSYLTNKNFIASDTWWGVKLQITGKMDDKTTVLQLNYEVPKDYSLKLDQVALKSKISEIKGLVQLHYKEGNWKALYDMATYVDMRILAGVSFIQE